MKCLSDTFLSQLRPMFKTLPALGLYVSMVLTTPTSIKTLPFVLYLLISLLTASLWLLVTFVVQSGVSRTTQHRTLTSDMAAGGSAPEQDSELTGRSHLWFLLAGIIAYIVMMSALGTSYPSTFGLRPSFDAASTEFDIVGFISTLGFPIVMCLLVYMDLRGQIMKRLDTIEERLIRLEEKIT